MMALAHLILTFGILSAVNAANGKFDTSGGSSCKWNDISYDDDVHSLFLDCKCAGSSGKYIEYTCEYYGKLSDCEMFGKRGGAERFYHHIADHMKGSEYVATDRKVW